MSDVVFPAMTCSCQHLRAFHPHAGGCRHRDCPCEAFDGLPEITPAPAAEQPDVEPGRVIVIQVPRGFTVTVQLVPIQPQVAAPMTPEEAAAWAEAYREGLSS